MRASPVATLEGSELLLELLRLPEVGLQLGLLVGARLLDVVLELRDLGRQVGELLFDERDPADARVRLGEILARALGGDDLDPRVGARVDFVALPVVPVKVRVDDLANRLLRQALDLLVERARRRRLRVGVDDHDTVVRQDDGRVTVDLVPRRGDRGVDAIADLLELEEILVGRLRVRRHGAAQLVRVQRVDGGGRDPDLRENLSTRPLLCHRIPSL